MGVDYFTCANPECGDTFADCGDYDTCHSCEKMFCGRTCSGIEETESDFECEQCGETHEHTCLLCRSEIITDDRLVAFLLKEYGLTRDEAETRFRNTLEAQTPS